MASERDNHPSVVRVRAEAAQLDDRTRADRAANCLVHGHPREETIDTGFGRFCPHCCDFVDPEPEPKPPAETVDTEETVDEAPPEPEKPAAKPKPAPKKAETPAKGAKKST